MWLQEIRWDMTKYGLMEYDEMIRWDGEIRWDEIRLDESRQDQVRYDNMR